MNGEAEQTDVIEKVSDESSSDDDNQYYQVRFHPLCSPMECC